MARAIDPVLQRLGQLHEGNVRRIDQLRLSQREWFDRVDRRQETHQSGLQCIETRMGHWTGGLTALDAAGGAAMTFLVGVIKAHWPS